MSKAEKLIEDKMNEAGGPTMRVRELVAQLKGLDQSQMIYVQGMRDYLPIQFVKEEGPVALIYPGK